MLVVLPVSEEGLRAAWPLVEALDVARNRLSLVVISERVAYAPDRFAGSVRRVAPSDLDWRGLPRPEALTKSAGLEADIAINLSDPNDLAATFLVGTSPAAVRVGRYRPGSEVFYDLMLAGSDSASELVASLRHALGQIDPPIVLLT